MKKTIVLLAVLAALPTCADDPVPTLDGIWVGTAEIGAFGGEETNSLTFEIREDDGSHGGIVRVGADGIPRTLDLEITSIVYTHPDIVLRAEARFDDEEETRRIDYEATVDDERASMDGRLEAFLGSTAHFTDLRMDKQLR